MSLVTKCPSCFTSFIVKPKQLKSHQGQVRCGQCQHIFIAKDFLTEPSTLDSFLDSPTRNIQPKKLTFLILYALLVLLGLVQALYFLRTDVVKKWPGLKPLLTTSCHYFGCTLPLPKNAELMAIDDTELIKDEAHEGIVKFNCIIVNNAAYTQSFPSLELTLTDKQDIPLMRRKITASEYLKGQEGRQQEGLAGNDEIRIALSLKTADMPVTGFRAFVVY